MARRFSYDGEFDAVDSAGSVNEPLFSTKDQFSALKLVRSVSVSLPYVTASISNELEVLQLSDITGVAYK